MNLRPLAALLLFTAVACPAAPAILSHQGRMAVNGVLFDGTGRFKFALVDGNGSVSWWSNDNTSTAGSQPAGAVSLAVSKGIYSVLLGDPSIAGMSALPASVFQNDDVRLRVWFDDGVHGFEQITPDMRLAASAYSMAASGDVPLHSVVAPPQQPVVAWGENRYGQTTVPASLSSANTQAIAAGGRTSVALLKDGTVIEWGGGAGVPAGLQSVTAIAAGVNHRLARRADGTVAAWGDNSSGQCATGSLTNVLSIAAGQKHSLFLHTGGTVTVIGDNTFGQGSPPALSGVTAIACGHDHCLALRADGTVAAWGRNETNQCDVPAGLSGVVSIAAGAFHSLAVKADGSVTAWGWNSAGQCGVPAGLTTVTKVCGGYAASYALRADGTVVAWGDNSSTQGNLPAAAADVSAIAAGDAHCLVLRAGSIPAQLARLDQTNVFTGRLGIGRTPAANELEVQGHASKTTAGNWLANSDARIKTDVRTVTDALTTLDQVRLVEFRYTPEFLAAHPGTVDRTYLNVIAQEFQRIFPGYVRSSGETLPDGTSVLQVDTYPLTIYSAAAVQELHRENQMLKQKLNEQEERLRKLEEALKK